MRLEQNIGRFPGHSAVVQVWLPGTGQRIITPTLQDKGNLDLLNLSVEERRLKISEKCMCQSGWNSKHFQGKCAESMLSVDAGASLLRSTVRRTREKGTSIAGRSGMVMMTQGWGGVRYGIPDS